MTTIGLATLAAVALLALVALAAVRLKPRVDEPDVTAVVELYPHRRPAAARLAELLPKENGDERLQSVERVLGVRGPTLASATRPMPAGVTGLALPLGYGYPGAVGSTGLPYMASAKVFDLTECKRTSDGWRVVLRGSAYRATADERRRVTGVFEETSGDEVASSVWSKVRDTIEAWEARRQAEERRQKWAAEP